MHKIKVTIEVVTENPSSRYPDYETVFEQVVQNASDIDLINIIKAANRIE